MSDSVLVTAAGRVGTLSLNRPDARNALSLDLLTALNTAAEGLRHRDDLTVLVLAGEGKAFCAGMDLKAVLNDPSAPLALLSALAEFTIKLRSLPMVVVAKVHGAAIGGGCGLACVADIALSHDDAKLGFPEVDLGVCPAVVAPWLVRKVGAGRARRILLSGGLMSGREAHQAGIVDQCAASVGDLDALCAEVIGRLASGGPAALRATKGLLNQLDESINPEYVRRGAELSAKVIATPETQQILREKFGL